MAKHLANMGSVPKDREWHILAIFESAGGARRIMDALTDETYLGGKPRDEWEFRWWTSRAGGGSSGSSILIARWLGVTDG